MSKAVVSFRISPENKELLYRIAKRNNQSPGEWLESQILRAEEIEELKKAYRTKLAMFTGFKENYKRIADSVNTEYITTPCRACGKPIGISKKSEAWKTYVKPALQRIKLVHPGCKHED